MGIFRKNKKGKNADMYLNSYYINDIDKERIEKEIDNIIGNTDNCHTTDKNKNEDNKGYSFIDFLIKYDIEEKACAIITMGLMFAIIWKALCFRMSCCYC